MSKPNIEYVVDMYALKGMNMHRIKVCGYLRTGGKAYRCIKMCSAKASEIESATELLKFACDVDIGQKFLEDFPLYLEPTPEAVIE